MINNIVNRMNNEEYKYVCEKCDYKCKFECEWIKHCMTGLHMNGKRKTRIDSKGPYKCIDCTYVTNNKTTYKQHILNEHSDIEKRKKEFTFYCKLCDLGTFSKDIFNKHNVTKKHIKRETYKKN